MDKIIEKEWNKIKDYNILNSIEDLEKLFVKNPNGRCFRKFTSYPWSKGNFFFGTYDELTTFYRTSTEVPFYLDKQIGKKYGKLTILGFEVKIKNNKRVIYAKCKCDCGNTIIALFEDITKGNKSTCGCWKTKKINNSLVKLVPDIVEKYWDYDNNTENPKDILINSTKEYNWRDSIGSYKMAPIELIKKTSGTSLPEQIIFYYLRRIFKNVINRYRVKIGSKYYESDIFIQDINFAIEYDGVNWHKNKSLIDIDKYKNFKFKGITLLRVRENGLPIDNNSADYIILRAKQTSDIDESICSVYNQIIEILHKITNTFNLEDNKITVEKLKSDIIEILKQYKIGFESNSINNSILMPYFDYSKNSNLRPYQVPVNFSIPIYFICQKGYSINVSPNRILSSKNINKDCCFLDKCCPCRENNSLTCKLYNDYLYSQIHLIYHAFGVENIDDNILYRCNFDNYKEKLTNYFEKLLNGVLDNIKNLSEDNISTIRFIVFNSVLVSIDYTKNIIKRLIKNKLKITYGLRIFNFRDLLWAYGVEKYIYLMSDETICYYLFNIKEKYIAFDRLVSHENGVENAYPIRIDEFSYHLSKLIIQDYSDNLFNSILHLLRNNFNDELVYLCIKSLVEKIRWLKNKDKNKLKYILNLACSIQDNKLSAHAILLVNLLIEDYNPNYDLLVYYIFNYIQNAFGNKNSDNDKKYILNKCFHRNYYNSMDFLEEMLLNILNSKNNEIIYNNDIIKIMDYIIMSNSDYFTKNTHQLYCFLRTIRSVIINDKNNDKNNKKYIIHNDLLIFIKKCNMLIFLPYHINDYDNYIYMNSFCEEIKYYLDKGITINNNYLVNEISDNINNLSKDFIKLLIDTLKYVGKTRITQFDDLSYFKVDFKNIIKKLKDRLLSL